MRIAFVGCGYVADFYMTTVANYPELELLGVFDRVQAHARRFAKFHRVPVYPSYEAILADPRVDLVVNLTNPDSHYEVTKRALEAGKHVYSEKPLAMRLEHAEELVALADARGLLLGGAPCSVLGESAQTLWKAVREGAIGTPRLVYAEIDDGPVHIMGFEKWKSSSGAPWPAKDEFEVGCTLEHAGYYVGWFVNMFGPATRVTSFAHCLVPDKGIAVDRVTADFTVGCIEFRSGAVARLTCSIYGPHEHRLQIIGDDGVLSIADCWDYGSTVRLSKRTSSLALRAEKYPGKAKLAGLGPRRVPLVRKPVFNYKTKGSNPMDFARGIVDLADSLREGRAPRMSSRFALHVNEVVLALQSPEILGLPRTIRSSFEPMAPMPWAH
jgi:predicted dehydrogenase